MRCGKIGRLSVLTASVLVLWLWPTTLWAHQPALERNDPPNGASVCPGDVKRVLARFSAELDVKQSSISVSGPAGLVVQVPSKQGEKDPYASSEDSGEPAAVESAVDLNNPERNSLVAPLEPPLAAGVYTASWKAVDTVDKLATEGSFSFTVREQGCGVAIPLWGFVGLGAAGVAVLLGAGRVVLRRR